MSALHITINPGTGSPIALTLGNPEPPLSVTLQGPSPTPISISPTVPGPRGYRGAQGEQGIPGDRGEDGREVKLRVFDYMVQWQYVGDDTWIDLVSVAHLTGPKGDPGEVGVPGTPGEPGASAYDEWLSLGNTGSVSDFLLSLKGEKGDKGDRGEDGQDGQDGRDGENGHDVSMRVFNNMIQWQDAGGDWINLVSIDDLTGEKGDKGDPGEAGRDGVDGTNGTDGDDGADGYSAYEIAVSNGFVGSESQWLASLVGPKGDKGDAGVDGNDGTDGLPGEKGEKGDKGDKGDPGEKGDKGDAGTNGVDGTDGNPGVYSGEAPPPEWAEVWLDNDEPIPYGVILKVTQDYYEALNDDDSVDDSTLYVTEATQYLGTRELHWRNTNEVMEMKSEIDLLHRLLFAQFNEVNEHCYNVFSFFDPIPGTYIEYWEYDEPMGEGGEK